MNHEGLKNFTTEFYKKSLSRMRLTVVLSFSNTVSFLKHFQMKTWFAVEDNNLTLR